MIPRGLRRRAPCLPVFLLLASTAAYCGSIERPRWSTHLAIAHGAPTSTIVTVTFHDVEGDAVAQASRVVAPGATEILSLDTGVAWPENRARRPTPFVGSAGIRGETPIAVTAVGVYDNGAPRQAWCAARAAPACGAAAGWIPVPGGGLWPGVPSVPVANAGGDIVQPQFVLERRGSAGAEPLRLFQTLRPAGATAFAFSGWSLAGSDEHAANIGAVAVRGSGLVFALDRLDAHPDAPSRCAFNLPDSGAEAKIALLGPARESDPRWIFVAGDDPGPAASWRVEWLDAAGTAIAEFVVAPDAGRTAAVACPPNAVAARIECTGPGAPPFAVVAAGAPLPPPGPNAWAVEASGETGGARTLLAPLLLAGSGWTSVLQVFNPGAEGVEALVRLGAQPAEIRSIPSGGSVLWTAADATVPASVECEEPLLAAVFSRAEDGRRCACAVGPPSVATLVAPLATANYSPHRRTMLGGADRGNTRIAAKQHYHENEMDRLCLSPEASGYGWSHPSGSGNPQRAWERGDAAVRQVMIWRVRYTAALGQAMADFARRQPGCIWLMGNEPNLAGQAYQTPEEFAAGYHDLRQAIHAADPTARFAPFALAQDTTPELLYRPDPVPDPPPDPKTLFRMYLDRAFDFWSANYGGLLPMDYFAIHRYPVGDPNNIPGDILPKWGDGTLSDGRPSIREMRAMIDDLGHPDVPMLLTEYGVFWGDTWGWNDARRLAFMWHAQRWLEERQDELNIAGWSWFMGVRDKDVPWVFGPLIIQDFEEYQGIRGPWVTYLGQLYRDLSNGAGPSDESGATRYLRSRPFVPGTCPEPPFAPGDPPSEPWRHRAYLARIPVRAPFPDAAGVRMADGASAALYACLLRPANSGTALVLTRDASGRNRWIEAVGPSSFPLDAALARPAVPPCAWEGSGVAYGNEPWAAASVVRCLRIGDRDGLGRIACEAADRPSAALAFPYLVRGAGSAEVSLVNVLDAPAAIAGAWGRENVAGVAIRSATIPGRSALTIRLDDPADPLVPEEVSDPSVPWRGCLRVRADAAALVGTAVISTGEGPAAYAGVPEDRCGNIAWTPGVRRMVSGTAWTAASRFAVAALADDGEVAVEVDWLAPDGTVLLSHPVVIPAGSCLVFDTKDGGAIPGEIFAQLATALGDSFIGTVRLRASGGAPLAAAGLLRLPAAPALAANASIPTVARAGARFAIPCVRRSSFPPVRSWVDLLNPETGSARVVLSFHRHGADASAGPALRVPIEIPGQGLVALDILDGGAGIVRTDLDALGDPFLGFVRGEVESGSVIAQSWTIETLPSAAFGIVAVAEPPPALDTLGIR